MRYQEIDTFDGRRHLQIKIDFTRNEQQTIMNFLRADKQTVKEAFADRKMIELFVLEDKAQQRKISVKAFPDYAHLVSNGFVYIGIYIEDLTGVCDYTNSFWLGRDEYDIWEQDKDKEIFCMIAIEVKKSDEQGCPHLYDLFLYDLSIATHS